MLSVWVAPLPSGAVVLEWRGAMAEVDIEVTAKGALELLVEERGDAAFETSERGDASIEDTASLLDNA